MDSSITTQTLLIFLSFWGWVSAGGGGAVVDICLELTVFTQQAWELSVKTLISTAVKLTFHGDKKNVRREKKLVVQKKEKRKKKRKHRI